MAYESSFMVKKEERELPRICRKLLKSKVLHFTCSVVCSQTIALGPTISFMSMRVGGGEWVGGFMPFDV